MNKSIAKSFFLLSLLFILRSDVHGGASSWSFRNRLQGGLEYDSNVTEAVDNPQAATSLRFMFESKASHRGKKLYMNFAYRGGLQLYRDFFAENKLANEAQFGLQIKPSPRFSFGVENWGRLKIFLNRDIDYGLGYLCPYASVNLSTKISARAGMRMQALSYANYDVFNYKSLSFFTKVYWYVLKGLFVSPQIRYINYTLNRHAHTISPDKTFWFTSTENQNDRTTSLGFQIDYYHNGLLVDVSYHYDTNRSNSYGAGYSRHLFVFSLARQISALMVRFYASLQKKNYLDELLPFWPQFLDTDEENTNFLILDVSYPLSRHAVFSLRSAWYQNESPYAALYYKKNLLFAIIEIAF